MGSASGGRLIFVHIPQGLPFGLLVHDMVERFLLYFFTQSAHSQTRGTWTSPESMTIDRNAGGYAYASPGQVFALLTALLTVLLTALLHCAAHCAGLSCCSLCCSLRCSLCCSLRCTLPCFTVLLTAWAGKCPNGAQVDAVLRGA